MRIKSSRQRWIIAQMKKGAWLSEDRDAFMEESSYELRARDEKGDVAILGYVHDTTVDKLEAAGLIAMVDQELGRAVKDKRGRYVTTEWDYYIAGHPFTLPPADESDAEEMDTGYSDSLPSISDVMRDMHEWGIETGGKLPKLPGDE